MHGGRGGFRPTLEFIHPIRRPATRGASASQNKSNIPLKPIEHHDTMVLRGVREARNLAPRYVHPSDGQEGSSLGLGELRPKEQKYIQSFNGNAKKYRAKRGRQSACENIQSAFREASVASPLNPSVQYYSDDGWVLGRPSIGFP